MTASVSLLRAMRNVYPLDQSYNDTLRDQPCTMRELTVAGADRQGPGYGDDVTRWDEPQALTRLAFDEAGRAVAGIGGMHRAIAARAFAGRGGPARMLHDAISTGVYGAVRGGIATAGRGAALAVGLAGTHRTEPSTTPHRAR